MINNDLANNKLVYCNEFNKNALLSKYQGSNI
jgi:hypothetical protein